MLYPQFTECEVLLLKKILEDHPEYVDDSLIYDYYFRSYMFPQTWPTYKCGFETKCILSQGKFEQYTSVVILHMIFKDKSHKEFYGVFFDGEYCYYVEGFNSKFMHDLTELSVKNLGQARLCYSTKNLLNTY